VSDQLPRRLTFDELFPNGREIGDETLNRKLDELAALRKGYRDAIAEEMQSTPEAI
jgi:hypothetical protein